MVHKARSIKLTCHLKLGLVEDFIEHAAGHGFIAFLNRTSPHSDSPQTQDQQHKWLFHRPLLASEYVRATAEISASVARKRAFTGRCTLHLLQFPFAMNSERK